MDIFTVECPECHGSFYCDMTLLHLRVNLHCPHCDLDFAKELSPNLGLGGARRSTAAGVKGVVEESMIYVPRKANRKGD